MSFVSTTRIRGKETVVWHQGRIWKAAAVTGFLLGSHYYYNALHESSEYHAMSRATSVVVDKDSLVSAPRLLRQSLPIPTSTVTRKRTESSHSQQQEQEQDQEDDSTKAQPTPTSQNAKNHLESAQVQQVQQQDQHHARLHVQQKQFSRDDGATALQ
mmetsp:Transcript_11207/g.22931  ORF Transcript_11207/g.22931 Transcript_11207/m.22931 type:complete len:157 (-) Transcript_11207:33-503(-)